MHWKCCKTLELLEAFPPGPPPGTLPLDPTGALKWATGPHAVKLTRAARFDLKTFAQALYPPTSENKSLPLDVAAFCYMYV